MWIIIIFLICISTSTVANNRYQMISITVSLHQNPLPITISNILKNSNLNRLQIKIGHMISSSNPNFPKGITVLLYNKTQLHQDTMYALSDIFSFLYNPKFQIYLEKEQVTLLKDPNDRLCSQQLESILNLFMPCRNFKDMGLQHLFNLNELLSNYLSISLQWIPNQITIQFIFSTNKQIKNGQIKKGKCGIIQIVELIHQNNSLTLQSNQLKQLIRFNSVHYQTKTINKWYQPQKTIVHIVGLTDNIEKGEYFKIISMLPQGFQLKSINIYPKDFNYSLQLIEKEQQVFVLITLNLSQMPDKVIIHVNFKATLINFQKIETIGGGGEQLMNIPMLVGSRGMQFYNNNILVERLLQPDFSIPFHTITFTIAIIGYLWLTLWRVHKFFPKGNLQKIQLKKQ